MTETCVDSRLRGNDGYGEETPMPNGKKPTAAQIKKLRIFDEEIFMTKVYEPIMTKLGVSKQELRRKHYREQVAPLAGANAKA